MNNLSVNASTSESAPAQWVLDLEDTEDDEAEALPAAGPGPHSIVITCPSSDTSQILQEVALVFERTIDYEMDFNLGRIRGVAHDKCERVEFALQLHAGIGGKGGCHVLGFSRRSGSTALFTRLIAGVQANLAKASFCTEVARTPGAAAGMSGGESVAAWLPAEGEEMRLDEASCQALVGMCSSEFADVQREALGTLGALVASPRACEEIQGACGDQLVAALEVAGRSSDDELQWLCAYVVAHMCTVPTFCTNALALVPTLFALLKSPATLSRRGSKRHAARALELVSRGDGQAVLRQAGRYLGVLEQLFHDPDAVLRASIRLIVQQVTA